MLITNLTYFLLSALALIVSSIILVKTLDKIAQFLRISEFTAAFIIMAIATSIPELFVGISSAIAGVPALSLGNIIGANIIDITLVVGIFVLISKKIKVKKERVGKDVYYILGSVVLLVGLMIWGNGLSRIDGALLIGLFVINSIRLLRKRKKYPLKYEEQYQQKYEIILSVALFIFALGILFIASKYAVDYATRLALDLSLPNIIIGLFLLSFATTLPELIFGIRACMTGHKQMAIGNQTGTIFVNATLIIGIVALIKPIEAAFIPFIISAAFLFVSVFIFITLIRSDYELTMGEGVSLILLYVLFTILEFFIKFNI